MENNKIILLIFAITLVILINSCSEKNSFGPYGSTHNHADFKVYILGQALNFNSPKFQVMEDLTHLENNDGDVLHVHVTGMTLGYFLKSIGMIMDNECITTDTGNQYCNLGKATLKVYLKNQNTNWRQIYDVTDYIINDLDKILVSYGTEAEDEINEQQSSVTDKAKDT